MIWRHATGADGRGAAPRSLRTAPWFRIAAITVSILLTAWLFPRTSLVDFSYDVGSIWPGDTVRARFAFPLYKDEDVLQRDIQDQLAKVLPIFVPTGRTTSTLSDTLGLLAQQVATATDRPPWLSDSAWSHVQSLPEESRGRRTIAIASIVDDVLSPIYNAGVIDRRKSTIPGERIDVRYNAVNEASVPINMLYDSTEAVQVVESRLPTRLRGNSLALARDLFRQVFTPTMRYSDVLTSEERNDAVQSVARTEGVVAEGEVIVAPGQTITERTKKMLASYQKSRQLREQRDSPWLQLIGNFAHVVILLGPALLYLYYFRPRIFYDNLQLGISLAGVLLMAVFAYVSLEVSSTLPIEYLIPMPFLAMLLVILFDSRTAFYLTVTASFIVAGLRGADYGIAIACLAAGVLAIYAVRDIKSRTQLFRSIAFSLLGYSLAILAIGLGRGEGGVAMETRVAFAAINALASPVLTFGTIMLLESRFNIATDLKLLEFDNLNHPLLRALADKAPGTYQHTLTISRLAESAATAVGANALMAKVGAYFHDIGKIPRAEYFVENQMGMGNKHDRIKPEQSAKILRNHVVEGLEIGRQYKLPQRILDFIPMHHGTTVMKYFLDKALETNPDADPDQFRYPGPLPQTREAAIVMLADAVEATTRSLPDPTKKAIEETVDRIIKRRFSDGQLDQCELTLADLTKIKTAFVKNLIGMSHPRIQYKPEPGQPPETGAEPPPPKERKPKEREEPVIPYIDDAFGNIEAEFAHRKKSSQEKPDDRSPEPGEGE